MSTATLTSDALPFPQPARPLPFPHTTVAVNRISDPPLVTFVVRLTSTTVIGMMRSVASRCAGPAPSDLSSWFRWCRCFFLLIPWMLAAASAAPSSSPAAAEPPPSAA